MKINNIRQLHLMQLALVSVFINCCICTKAQTEVDAIMMNKNQFCNGFIYSNSSWSNYWEGKLKRINENIGTVSSNSLAYMANFGVSDRLNIMLGAPYVQTKASSGTLQGVRGMQDASLFVKWKALNKKIGSQKIAVFAIAGISTPLQNYVKDYLPLSIGLGSTNMITRAMVDYQWKKWTITASSSYLRRSNIRLDRDFYYTTQLHNTNEVYMPDVLQSQIRVGYRGKYFIAEGLLSNVKTLGGFDISRNNMPFPSNRMNGTSAGAYIKYSIKSNTNFSLLANAMYTLSGRNIGQSTMYSAGVFYAFYFKKKNENSNQKKK